MFFGVSLGSFLNVVIDRVPAGQSLLRPPSRCPACGYRLTAGDLIPVLSYLMLRGRCRKCAAPIPPRVVVVEALSGAIVAGAVAYYGLTGQAAFISLSCLFLLALTVIDIEQGIVPHALVLPGLVAAFAASFFYPPLGWKSSLLGAGVAFGIFLLLALVRGGGIGWGDVKLAPVLGALTGFPSILFAFFASFILGGAFGAAVLLSRRAGRKTPVPFVPFLAAGTVVALLWGEQVTTWYLSLFG